MKIEQLQPLMRKNVLLPIAAGAVAVVLLIRLVYLPLGALIAARRAALQDLMVRIADTHVLAGQIPQQENALQDAEKRFQALKSRIGQGQSVARILDVLSQQAKDRRIELVAVQGRRDNDQARVLTWGGAARCGANARHRPIWRWRLHRLPRHRLRPGRPWPAAVAWPQLIGPRSAWPPSRSHGAAIRSSAGERPTPPVI